MLCSGSEFDGADETPLESSGGCLSTLAVDLVYLRFLGFLSFEDGSFVEFFSSFPVGDGHMFNAVLLEAHSLSDFLSCCSGSLTSSLKSSLIGIKLSSTSSWKLGSSLSDSDDSCS